MNVVLLRTRIPNNKYITATKKKYENYSHKKLLTKVITIFLVLILTLNKLVFNSKFYVHVKGSAMQVIQHTKVYLSIDKR